MKQIIKFRSSKEHYKADACVVWCFDDRFTGLLGELNKFGWRDIDLVRVAGGAVTLTGRGEEYDFDFVADQVAKSIRLHHTPLVILMVHKDCGAYKALSLPPKGMSETELLKDDLSEARENLIEYLESGKGYSPEIRTYLADFDGLWEL